MGEPMGTLSRGFNVLMSAIWVNPWYCGTLGTLPVEVTERQ